MTAPLCFPTFNKNKVKNRSTVAQSVNSRKTNNTLPLKRPIHRSETSKSSAKSALISPAAIKPRSGEKRQRASANITAGRPSRYSMSRSASASFPIRLPRAIWSAIVACRRLISPSPLGNQTVTLGTMIRTQCVCVRARSICQFAVWENWFITRELLQYSSFLQMQFLSYGRAQGPTYARWKPVFVLTCAFFNATFTIEKCYELPG